MPTKTTAKETSSPPSGDAAKAPLVSTNPATGAILWQGSSASALEVDAAVQRSKKAFTAWANTPLTTRISLLESFAQVLSRNKTSMAETLSMEVGKPLWEARGEVDIMINKIALSLEAYGVRCPEKSTTTPLARTVTRHRPHGVLAVLGPFNFPGHLPNGHIVPALLAGNTIVFKPSELTPLVGERTLSYWQEAGLPAGVLSLVQGGKETGQTLASHSDIDGLLFTGSWSAGRHLAEAFSKTPGKILALEMGGNNPLVVAPIKNIEAAAYHIIQSAFLTTGQRCTCARRLIMIEGEHCEPLLDRLLVIAAALKVGPYTAVPEPFMGPLIHAEAAAHLLKAQQRLVSNGGRPLLEMRALPLGPCFVSPGIIDVTGVSPRLDEEFFGPLLQVIRVGSLQEAIQEANRTAFGLSASLFSDQGEDYHQFLLGVRAGVINWNMPTTGASGSAPFGGLGHSGNHRPSAYYAADYCSYPVASMEAAALALPSTLTPGITLGGS